jgi:hypothetical protein
LAVSTTKAKSPLDEIVTLHGSLNPALVPIPFVVPIDDEPAKVVTVIVSRRI